MLAACSLALVLAAAAPSPTPGAFPYPIHHRALDNGLQVVFVPQPTPGLVAYFTVFRVGSRDETEPGRSGFAHLIEHLTYRGTPAHPGEDWERATKRLGLDTNAFTDDDVTAYWLSGPSSALPSIIELESDRFMNLHYTEGELKVESRAVLGELLQSLASPDSRVNEAARALAFTRHAYRHPTIGLERDVRDMPGGYQYSLDLYRRLYTPDDATVLVVGDFDEEATFQAIQRGYGAWTGKGVAAPVQPEPPQVKAREARVAWPSPILPRLWSGWHTPGAQDLDATATQLVLWPLLFGRPSALHRVLVHERRLVEDIGGDFQPHRDPYLFGVEMVLKGAAAERPVRAALDGAIADLAAGKVDERLLADVKAHVRSSLVMETDTPYRTGVWLVYYDGISGDPGYLDRVMARVATVSAADVSRFVRRWLVPANRTTVVVATDRRKPGARAEAAR